jgi:hypothetical protein
VAQVFWAKHDDDDDEKKDATAAVHSTITPVVVPLFVSLPSAFGRECAQCDLIDEVLERRGLGKATRDVLRAKVRFVLILDAFDEISAAYAGGASVLNLSDRLGLGLWNAKTMVSCRSGVTMDESSLFRVGDTPPSVLHICPFDPTRVSAYVVGFAKSPMNKSGWDAAQYADALSGASAAQPRSVRSAPFDRAESVWIAAPLSRLRRVLRRLVRARMCQDERRRQSDAGHTRVGQSETRFGDVR